MVDGTIRTPGRRLDPIAHDDTAFAGERAVPEGHVMDAAGRARQVDLPPAAGAGRGMQRHAYRIVPPANDRADRPGERVHVARVRSPDRRRRRVRLDSAAGSGEQTEQGRYGTKEHQSTPKKAVNLPQHSKATACWPLNGGTRDTSGDSYLTVPKVSPAA